MRQGHVISQDGATTGAVIDNRSGLPDSDVRAAIMDQWTEVAGLQFGHPSTFQMYATNQGSMLARTPFRTPRSVMEEVKLARSVADTDDDIGAIIGEMIAIAFGEGVVNQHRDETTLEFYNQMTGPTGMDLVSVFEEMYRELLIAGQVTTLTLFGRKRMQYYPLKSEVPVQAQLQVPIVGVLPAEHLRVVTNDIMGQGQLAYHVTDNNMKAWLDEYLDPRTPGQRRAIMAMQEPVAAAVFTGKFQVPLSDSDPESRGLVLYTLNQSMVKRTTLPKGASPYPRPLLTRNFALLEAKRLLNVMDYALLQGGTNYIVVVKKGTDNLPAQPGEVDNLIEQARHASRSGVLVGDHRLNVEIITPNLTELLNPNKRKLLGRKLKMGLMRQSEEVPGDTGNQGAVNEMELTARVISSDRAKLIRHAQATFYDDTATRNRSTFRMGAPSIWAPKIVLNNVAVFWQNLLQARDRGDIPRRWIVEALGYDYDAAIAERERELARGDDEVLTPGSVPFSNPGEPQDNNSGRPPGSSSNNGTRTDSPQPANARPRQVLSRNAGETVTAMVENDQVMYVGETTHALLEQYAETADFTGYVTAAEREAIDTGQPQRAGSSIVVPVNGHHRCEELACVKLDAGLRMIVGRRVGDGAMLARALRFQEPQYDLARANETALRWGFTDAPLVEAPVSDEPPAWARALIEQVEELAKGNVEKGKYVYLKCPNCGLVQDADHSKCSRCGQDLTEARRGMFAYYEQKNEKPTLHSKPPPPAKDQPDLRKTQPTSKGNSS